MTYKEYKLFWKHSPFLEIAHYHLTEYDFGLCLVSM